MDSQEAFAPCTASHTDLGQMSVPWFSSPSVWVLSQETPYFFSLRLDIGVTKAKNVWILFLRGWMA